jgi:ADP-heptose:LPS heptosyltransferase
MLSDETSCLVQELWQHPAGAYVENGVSCHSDDLTDSASSEKLSVTPRERVLVLQFRRIGDVLLTTPLLEALHAARPTWEIAVLVDAGCEEPLANHPAIAERVVIPRESWFHPLGVRRALARVRACAPTIAVDVLSTPFSAAVAALSGARQRIGFDLRMRRPFYTHPVPRIRTPLYTALARQELLRPLGVAPVHTLPRVAPGFARTEWARAAIGGVAAERPLVLISPTSRRRTRRWPHERYGALANHLATGGAKVLVLWGAGERPDAEAVIAATHPRSQAAIAPETPDLRALAGLLSEGDMLIGNDNGVRHLAVALGVPTVGVFGPSEVAPWTPPGRPEHRVVRGTPCTCADHRRCGRPTCIESISVESVAREASALLNDLMVASRSRER